MIGDMKIRQSDPRQRCHSCLYLNTLMIIEMDIPIYHIFRFTKGGRLVAIDTFYFEDSKNFSAIALS